MNVCWSMSLIVKASPKGPRVERNRECGSQQNLSSNNILLRAGCLSTGVIRKYIQKTPQVQQL